jgi:hypothetical protein
MQKAWAFIAQADDFAHCYAEEMMTRDWIRWEQVGGARLIFCSPPLLIAYIPFVTGTIWEGAKYRLCKRLFARSRKAST